MKNVDCILVSVDFTHGKDKGVLVVGGQNKGAMKIINAFQGEEAYDLYLKLTTKKDRKGE